VTDGQPNIIYIHDERYAGSWPGDNPQQFVLGKADTETALAYFESLITIEEGDEIDAEAVGDDTDQIWLRDYIVRPQPGYNNWPPTGPGWVRYVDDFSEFANTIHEKFQIIFEQIENCATLEALPLEINPDNNIACIVVIPQNIS
jgi:hypothetical protein